MTELEKLQDSLRREIAVLETRLIVSDDTMQALKRIKSTLFGFGFYDPATESDRELARLLAPDWDIVDKAFHL